MIKVLVSFSGGKDSQACLILAAEERRIPDGGLFEEIEENSACMSLYHGLCE